jgi:glycerol-3-phosphate dehydrogenase
VQGSHIVVRKMFDHDRAYIFQNADNRIIFAIPYERDYTLIGTTDQDWPGDPGAVEISDGEIRYLCEAASEYFAKPVTPDDVVWTYSGVRPLYDDGASKAQEATRDYVLKLEGGTDDRAPLLNLFGGKITTFRRLAEHVLEKVGHSLGAKGRPWTAGAAFAGGDFSVTGFESLVDGLRQAHPFLSDRQARRYARLYGTEARRMLEGADSAADLGTSFGADLTAREADWLVAHEWAETAEDIAFRRTKAGLAMDKSDLARLEAHLHKSQAG